MIKANSFRSLFGDLCLCPACHKQFGPIFLRFRVDGAKAMALYEYSDAFRSALYQLKGCGDIELAKSFLSYFLPILKLAFRGYVIVPAPSSKSHDERRGFNQVVELSKPLGLPIIKALTKDEAEKQSGLSSELRREVGKHIHMHQTASIRGKKVLLVDDVYTTGSTVKACLALLRRAKPKKLRVLVVAKTRIKTH